MEFKPKLMATALPGMPHKDVGLACDVMLRYFPQAPGIPRVGSLEKLQLDGLPCLKADPAGGGLSFELSGRESELVEFYDKYLSGDLEYFAVKPEYDPAMHRLAELFARGRCPELKILHFSVRGPYTYGLVIKDEQGSPAFYNETMRDLLVKHFAMKARWREKQVAELFPGVQTLVSIGEAGLGVYSSAGGSGSWEAIKNAINEVTAAIGGIRCIHCCGNFDWSMLMRTDTACLNFDTYQYGDTMPLYADELQRFLERGGLVAWGITPTAGGGGDVTNETPASLEARFEAVIDSICERGVDRERLLEASMLSPTCSTNTLSVELSDRVYQLTAEVARSLRQKYFPGDF
ncbi:MAG: hypothetical protein V1691_02405 [Chloroflexota bacterium]